ncbi:MAG: LmbE family N-acetylglucosaminyl deacetylase [Parvicellaceae bacterium]|jgi:LmbE family N-acetylglucosaminyl deacetylase
MRYIAIISIVFISLSSAANKGAGEIYVSLQKLHSLKRVLYVAAHPDDENTRALAYFSLGEKAETAYFSFTRGDGGQNLIGDELSENLGVLRTQELLAARSYDGAKQYFSRAVDFGYSKSADESLSKWGKDEVLSDLVLVIRQFKPDVIITRFPPDTRAGHGHHTASAMMAIEAFEKAADPKFLPSQVNKYGAWKSTSVYWNTSYWWDKDIATMTKGDPNYLITDIGGYNSSLGQSYTEIGTLARSQHKCQGFGGLVERGSRTEYFKHLAGEQLKNSFFEKSTRSWSDIIDKDFEKSLQDLMDDFDFVNTEKNVPALMDIRKELLNLPDTPLNKEKRNRCDQIILDCLGLYLEIGGADFACVRDLETMLTIHFVNRSSSHVELKDINFNTGNRYEFTDTLVQNVVLNKEIKFTANPAISNPYWLDKPFDARFSVADKSNLGKPENDPTFIGYVHLIVDGTEMNIGVPVSYKWRDPSYGERRRMMISTPRFATNFEQKLEILKPNEVKTIRLNVHSFLDSLVDEVQISAPKGWNVSPKSLPVYIKSKHDEVWLEFKLSATEGTSVGKIQLKDSKGKELYSFREIAYDHIPTQVIFSKAALDCKQLDAKINPGKVAYIKGVDDAVPNAITQLGFELEVFEVNDLLNIELSQFQTVVLGIRIYNVHPELSNFQNQLNDYVKEGGNLVMQYNTASRSLKGKTYGPTPFELSRKRVTEEDATVKFLAPKHAIMNTPNKITEADFEDWVQERGLYFADNWDKSYTPLLSWSDQGEDPVEGALIVTKYGKGQFVYAGISFFRELPNGVIGAYRLFANILSYQP